MLRRAALLLCLAAPLAASAQTTDIVTITPAGPFGRIACEVSSPDPNDDPNPTMRVDWTLPTTTAVTVNDTWRIYAANANSCPTADAALLGTVAATAGVNTGFFPASGSTLRFLDVLAKAGVDCTGAADKTVYICVALRRSGVGTDEKSKVASFTIQLAPPPAPTGLIVKPGDGALNLEWSAGTVGTGQVATDRYRVSVTPVDSANGGTRTSETAARSIRVAGLVNGAAHDISVVALSSGGNESLTALTGTGQPQPVNDFFDMCDADPTCPEQGGCGGGPAGLLSLLGLAAALRLARRRS